MQIERYESYLAESIHSILEILVEGESHKVTHSINENAFKFSRLELCFSFISEVADS